MNLKGLVIFFCLMILSIIPIYASQKNETTESLKYAFLDSIKDEPVNYTVKNLRAKTVSMDDRKAYKFLKKEYTKCKSKKARSYIAYQLFHYRMFGIFDWSSQTLPSNIVRNFSGASFKKKECIELTDLLLDCNPHTQAVLLYMIAEQEIPFTLLYDSYFYDYKGKLHHDLDYYFPILYPFYLAIMDGGNFKDFFIPVYYNSLVANREKFYKAWTRPYYDGLYSLIEFTYRNKCHHEYLNPKNKKIEYDPRREVIDHLIMITNSFSLLPISNDLLRGKNMENEIEGKSDEELIELAKKTKTTDHLKKMTIYLLSSYYGNKNSMKEVVSDLKFAYDRLYSSINHSPSLFSLRSSEEFKYDRLMADVLLAMADGHYLFAANRDICKRYAGYWNKWANDKEREYAKNIERIRREESIRTGQIFRGIQDIMNIGMAYVFMKNNSSSANGFVPSYNAGSSSNVSIYSGNYAYSGNVANRLSTLDFNSLNQALLAKSMLQVQQKEMEDYSNARAAYQRMGRDLSYDEWVYIKSKAIAQLKENGYDVVAEQKAISEDLRNFNRSQMNSGRENVERIKEQNAAKYGGRYSPASSTSSSLNSGTSTASIGKTTPNAPTIASPAIETSGASSNSYRYIQRKVNIHENPNSNSAVVFPNCGVYQKGSQYYVEIRGEYHLIQKCNKQHYNRTVTHGSHPYYFNM